MSYFGMENSFDNGIANPLSHMSKAIPLKLMNIKWIQMTIFWLMNSGCQSAKSWWLSNMSSTKSSVGLDGDGTNSTQVTLKWIETSSWWECSFFFSLSHHVRLVSAWEMKWNQVSRNETKMRSSQIEVKWYRKLRVRSVFFFFLDQLSGGCPSNAAAHLIFILFCVCVCVCSPPSLQSPPPSLDFVSGKFFCSFWSHVEHVINAPTPVINSVMENLLIVLVRNRLLLLVAVVVAVAVVVVVVVVVWWCFFRLPCGSDVSILERTIFFVVLPTKLKRTMTMNARNVDRNFLHEHQKKTTNYGLFLRLLSCFYFHPFFHEKGFV